MSAPWWNKETVAVVTGANKGIGFEIAKGLASRGFKTVLTARNGALGQEATSKIASACGDPQSILFHQLDITNADSVKEFTAWVDKEFGGLAVLVNNAGFAYKGDIFGATEAKTTLDVNYFGTKAATESLKPLIKDGGRVVNVSSSAGRTSIIRSPALLAQFTSADRVDQVDDLAHRFISDIASGQHTRQGWPNSMYGVSKLCESMYTRILGLDPDLRRRGIMVNACCPGWCQTSMSSFSGNKSAAEGADTPLWLATLPPQQYVTGGFFSERTQRQF